MSKPRRNNPDRVTINPKSKDLVRGVTYNVANELVVITVDKIDLCLRDHVQTMEQKKAWHVPATLGFSTLASLVTNTFSPRFGVSGEMWKSLYIVITAIAAGYAVKMWWKSADVKSVSELIHALKASGTGFPSDDVPIPSTPATPQESPPPEAAAQAPEQRGKAETAD